MSTASSTSGDSDVDSPMKKEDSMDSDEVQETVVAKPLDYPNNQDYSKNSDDDDDESSSANSSQSDDDNSDDEVVAQDAVPDEIPIDIPSEKPDIKPLTADGWPTLAILPGGVIKHREKEEPQDPTEGTGKESDPIDDKEDMMYACAQCPQKFKFLFCLVKHVRWHEEEKKQNQGLHLCKLNNLEKELLSIKRARLDADKKYWKQKMELMTRIVLIDKRFIICHDVVKVAGRTCFEFVNYITTPTHPHLLLKYTQIVTDLTRNDPPHVKNLIIIHTA